MVGHGGCHHALDADPLAIGHGTEFFAFLRDAFGEIISFDGVFDEGGRLCIQGVALLVVDLLQSLRGGQQHGVGGKGFGRLRLRSQRTEQGDQADA